jgi:hypothetical protein
METSTLAAFNYDYCSVLRTPKTKSRSASGHASDYIDHRESEIVNPSGNHVC